MRDITQTEHWQICRKVEDVIGNRANDIARDWLYKGNATPEECMEVFDHICFGRWNGLPSLDLDPLETLDLYREKAEEVVGTNATAALNFYDLACNFAAQLDHVLESIVAREVADVCEEIMANA